MRSASAAGTEWNQAARQQRKQQMRLVDGALTVVGTVLAIVSVLLFR